MDELQSWAKLLREAERRSPGSEATSRRIGYLLGLGIGAKVLELSGGACPTGRLLARDHGCAVTCVDLDDADLHRVAELARRDGVEGRVQTLKDDPLQPPLPEQSFEGLVAEGTLHFASGTFYEALVGLRRLLAPNGRLAISVRARVAQELPGAISAWFQERKVTLLFPREVALELERAGFEPLAAEAFPDAVVEDFVGQAERCLAKAGPEDAVGAQVLRRELELHRQEGGRTALAMVLFVARRKEPGERPPPSRGRE